MWLINVETRLLEEFIGLGFPHYAILSHTWEAGQEVTFQEFNQKRGNGQKTGYRKIDMTCQQAARDGLDYAWVDTCCIDKSSSAELTEAINSMYRWYQRAAVCYVYLDDLVAPVEDPSCGGVEDCRWFTRAWTLQELIAPTHMKFYSQSWDFCFTKASAAVELSEITSIDFNVLNRTTPLTHICVAQKMSWVQSRRATRVEDVAYSLLGIFNIAMPLLYGEEEKAFFRLQCEIIRTWPDPSIFAWLGVNAKNSAHDKGPDDQFSGVLAPSPAEFRSCGSYGKLPLRSIPDFSISNQGIKLRASFGLEREEGYPLVLPVCTSSGKTFGIKVRNIGAGLFVRQDATSLALVNPMMMTQRLKFEPSLLTELPVEIEHRGEMTRNIVSLSQREYVLQIATDIDISLIRRWPWKQWDEVDKVFFNVENPDSGWACVKIATITPRAFENAIPHGTFDVMLYVFGWANQTTETPRFTMMRVDGSPDHRALEDMNEKAVAEDWDAYWVANRLVNNKIPEQSGVVAGPNEDHTLLLTCNITVANDEEICPNPYWRVQLDWVKVPNDGISDVAPYLTDKRWEGIHWNLMINT